MKYEASDIQDYITQIPVNRVPIFEKLIQTVRENISEGIVEGILYGIPSFYVSLDIYPSGYHVKPNTPLPFISIASQKHFIAFYHMGIYTNEDLKQQFIKDYFEATGKKPDMGKSCIRLKPDKEISYDVFATLCRAISTQQWINIYENSLHR